MRSLLLGALLLCAAPARALFDATEMDVIDVEPKLDTEYFLHTLVFSYPGAWDQLWDAASSTTPAYRINAASLDCCSLLLQQDLRLRKVLTRGLDFKFRLLQDEDKEHQFFHYQLELEQKLGLGFSASLFGEPTFRKEDSDIGFGLAYAPSADLRASARHTFVDFNFNKRGSTTQRYETTPATDEVSLEARAGPEWRAAAYLMVDSPLRRDVPDENRTFSYRRTDVDLSLSHEPAGRWSRRLSYGYEFEAKGDLFDPAPAGKVSVAARKQMHRVLLAAAGALGERGRLELGHQLILRAARADYAQSPDAGIFYRRWEAQPYARWRQDLKPWLTSELAGFLSFGENRQRGANTAPSFFHTVVEATLGAGCDFVFSPSGRIGVYGTFDLDAIASHFWDGGNVRAMFLF